MSVKYDGKPIEIPPEELAEYALIDARREGYQQGFADGKNGRATEPTDTSSNVFPLLGFDDLQNLPDPKYLVEGTVPEGLTVAFGGPGTFKSFVVSSIGCSVAAGIPWFGHDVNPGHVVYVAGEGRGGLKARAYAWWDAAGRPDMSRMHWLPEAVNLRDRQLVERVRRTLGTLPEPPVLLLVDTMARSMPGGDENAARDVGEFIHGVDGLCPTRLVVHHTGHGSDRERGSSVLAGAADLRIGFERDGKSRRVTLTCRKMKDAAEWNPITLALEDHAESLVPTRIVEKDEARDDLRERVLEYVTDHGPVSKKAIRKDVRGRNPEIDKALQEYETARMVHSTPEGWERCPGPAGTLGHPYTPAPGTGVPHDEEPPVGGSSRGTPYAQPLPTSLGHALDEELRPAPVLLDEEAEL